MPSSAINSFGHNNPPTPAEEFKARVERYRVLDKELGPVSEENAQKYRDEIGLCGDLKKEIEAQHKTEKAPHLEAGRKVDNTYKPLADAAEDAKSRLKRLLETFVVARENAAKAAAAEARRKLEEAERAAAKAAEPEDDPFLAATADAVVVDVKAAHAEAKTAEMQAMAAGRVSSAAGGFNATSLKTKRSARIDNWQLTTLYYMNHGDMRALVQRLADADIRHAKGATIEIPGVEIVEERVL